MKSLTKILTFTLLLSLGSIFIINGGVSAQDNCRSNNETELQRPSSIKVALEKEIQWGGYFPPEIWYTRGDYRGYIYIESYRSTKDKTFIGLYRGTLYLNVAPLNFDPDEE